MKKFVLVIFVMFFTMLAYSATPAEVNECDRQCYACESGYNMRKVWNDNFKLVKEAVQYCRDALNFCESIGEDCPKAREIISNENEGL
jgi:hypothetical protein